VKGRGCDWIWNGCVGGRNGCDRMVEVFFRNDKCRDEGLL